MNLRRRSYMLRDLELVSPAPPPDVPPLGMGERCRLISGGPAMLIVDIEGDILTVAWRSPSFEFETVFPRACVRRVVS
jgi:hypothetical protein